MFKVFKNEEEEKKAAVKEEAAPKIGAMPNGDYMVHVSNSISYPVGVYTEG